MNMQVNAVVCYGGHNISANGSVNLTLKASYSELKNTVELMQFLNNDVSIKAKFPNEKPIKLGSMRIKDIRVDGDGESTLKFNGLNDYVEVDNLNSLITNEEFRVKFEADIEEEDEDNVSAES